MRSHHHGKGGQPWLPSFVGVPEYHCSQRDQRTEWEWSQTRTSAMMRKEIATMETFEAVRTILAVRSYQDRPVPEAILRDVVEAGRLTASSRNRQPWHFIVVQDRETLKRLGEMA